MKYITVGWPEIQDYMWHLDYNERLFYDTKKNVWLIPEEWEDDLYEDPDGIGDLEDAMG